MARGVTTANDGWSGLGGGGVVTYVGERDGEQRRRGGGSRWRRDEWRREERCERRGDRSEGAAASGKERASERRQASGETERPRLEGLDDRWLMVARPERWLRAAAGACCCEGLRCLQHPAVPVGSGDPVILALLCWKAVASTRQSFPSEAQAPRKNSGALRTLSCNVRLHRGLRSRVSGKWEASSARP